MECGGQSHVENAGKDFSKKDIRDGQLQMSDWQPFGACMADPHASPSN
jgi:hypothetical protein